MEKLKLSYIAGRNSKRFSHCGKVWWLLRKFNVELAYDPDLPLEKFVCRSGSKLELDMEQQTGSKLEKEYVYCAVYCNPAYLTYMWSTS